VSDHDPAPDMLTEPADTGRSGLVWRRNVIIAAVVLACMGAMVGTAFGLANGGAPGGGDDNAGGPGPTPTMSAEVSAEPSVTVSETSPAPDSGGECTSNCTQRPSTCNVPHVVGLDESSGRKKITDCGLSPKVQYVCDGGGGESGKITAQDPSSGTSLTQGKTVTLSLRGMKVPDVTGKPKDYAKSLLSEAGFNASTTTKASSAEPGTVLSQSPAGGSCVKPGNTTVTITVAGTASAPTTPAPAAAGNGG
jgi:hypothetical protein